MLYDLNGEVPDFRSDIIKILKEFYSELLNSSTKDEKKLNLIGEYSQIIQIFGEESFYKAKDNQCENNLSGDKNQFLEIVIDISDKINKCITKLKTYGETCNALNDYLDNITILKESIIKYNLHKKHFILMQYNYQSITNATLNLAKYLNFLQLWEKYNKELEQNYTSLFSKIINSNDFQKLYLTALKSSYVQIFIKENNLEESYNIFMEKYAKKINEYILYVPLTRGIKAYVSTYFRIALNINSVEIIGIFSEQDKEEILKSYILIQMLHESFHFLFRLKKEGKTALEALSPQRKKIHENYKEIGVDVILHLFGTEYITFISPENSKLLNNLESWEKNNTNFKVFNKVYLLEGKLAKEGSEITGSGLKCNISMNENNNLEDWKVCTNAAIRYCF